MIIGSFWSSDEYGSGRHRDDDSEPFGSKSITESSLDAGRVSRDTLFHILRNRRRRYAIHYLRRYGTAEIGAIAEQVAAWENRVPVAAVDSAERKRVYNSLQQTHLPKLADLGFVEYDTRTGTAALTPAADQFDVYLDVDTDGDFAWSEYYVGLSAVGVALGVAVWVGIYPLSLLPAVAWMAVLVGVFAVTSVVHFVHDRRRSFGNTGVPTELRRDGP